ncbi:hypothetical protein GALMADRAFT_82167, partial [Galerina marginata CBS 339.88]
SIATSNVPRERDLDIIRGCVHDFFPDDLGDKIWVGLPASKSYLRVLDVPTDQPAALGPTLPDHVRKAMYASALTEHLHLDGPVRLVRNSKSSTTSTAYFNIWDSKSGFRARALIGRTFMLGPNTLTIKESNRSAGVPQCQRCWKWGHVIQACKAQALRCPICSGPHMEEQHRGHAACCKGAPKANPPVPPTPVGQACPHHHRCSNCKKEHPATSNKCRFWGLRFDRSAIEALYTQVRERVVVRRPATSSNPSSLA